MNCRLYYVRCLARQAPKPRSGYPTEAEATARNGCHWCPIECKDFGQQPMTPDMIRAYEILRGRIK